MTILLVIISLSVLIFVHELGHFLAAKLSGMPVEEFAIGFPPRIVKKKIGETAYSIGALPFGGFVKISGEDGHDEGPRSFAHHSFYRKSSVILAGVFFNILAGWLALVILFSTGIPKHLFIPAVSPDSPAEEAGIQPGDIIVSANTREDLSTNSFINFTSAHRGEELKLTLLRDGKEIQATTLIRENPPQGEGAIGIQLVDIGLDPEPFPKSILAGTVATWENLALITRSFYDLITGIFTRPEVVEGLTGPVGIISIANQAATLGTPYLVQLMALISLNLAILNLIPFPALDGGRFLFLIIEKIIRRPISFKTQQVVNASGFAILILLMVLITIRDIANLS